MQQLKERFITKHRKEQSIFDRLKATISVDGVLHASNLLRYAAKHYPLETALISNDRTLRYNELYFRSLLLSKKLTSLGVESRDRVLLYFENSIEFYICYFAIWQIGAVCVPLNTFLHPKELAYIIQDANPRAILASGQFSNQLAASASYLDPKTVMPFVVTEAAIEWDVPLALSTDELLSLLPPVEVSADEMTLLLYTSGTTGVPKGVMLSSKNIITNTLQAAARLGMLNRGKEMFFRDRFFAALPLFHVFAQNTCLWLPLMVGGAIIIVSKIDRREILEGLKEKPTLFFGVPALYGLLCLLKTAPLDSIRFFISGGDAMPNKIRSAFSMIYGRKICAGYGLTEASPTIAVHMENKECATNVVGTPLLGITCEIRDETGNVLQAGNVGVLWVKGDNVMLGYYNAPEITALVVQDGWLCTGDLATQDTQGNLAIIGRSKDLIIHKGFNIYPQEVENVLLSHPTVFKAAVVGYEDAMSGQVPIAYVALREPTDDIERMLRDHCGKHLASYKIPRKIICLDDLPLNATGKIDKKQLTQKTT